MNCQTAESMVNRYIEHDLSVDELEDFLEHVENCPSCYDELETYFIVPAGDYIVEVTCLGYQTICDSLSIKDTTKRTYRLKEEVVNCIRTTLYLTKKMS